MRHGSKRKHLSVPNDVNQLPQLSSSTMGGALSHFFQSGHALLSSSHNRQVSEQTRRNIRTVFDALRANPKMTATRLEGLLAPIPRSENVLQIHNEEGYNLLQKCVGINNIDMARWCLSRNVDINRGACSLPLHIACLKGYDLEHACYILHCTFIL